MRDPYAAVRCSNTIHSNYVRDHQCQMRRGHGGDCLFGDIDAIRYRVLTLMCEAQGGPEAFRVMRAVLASDEAGSGRGGPT